MHNFLIKLIDESDEIGSVRLFGQLTAVLVKAVQEQQNIIKAQQREIDGLKIRFDRLEGSQLNAGQ